MNIEVIEFYPLEYNEGKGFLTGTLRVKLPDIGIHILGIFVSRQKGFWFFSLPGRKGTHHETGEGLHYPCVVFEDREKQRALMEAIREQGRIFIEQRLADTDKPLIFPQPTKKTSQQPNPSKSNNNPARAKEITSIEKLKPTQPVNKKQWMDMPKRKTTPLKK